MGSVIYAVIGYFFLLLTVRVLKRRAGSGISMLDFVLIFLIGGVIILGTMGEDRSMTNAMCVVITVGFLHRSVAWAKSKSPRIGALVDGVPIVVLDRGKPRKEVMDHMRITPLDIEIASRGARRAGAKWIDQHHCQRRLMQIDNSPDSRATSNSSSA